LRENPYFVLTIGAFSNLFLADMDQDQIERISNIKATAWTTLILFSLVGYFVFTNYLLETMFFRDGPAESHGEESSSDVIGYIDRVMIISILVCLYVVLVVYGSIGMLKLRLNGLIVYHATTILLIVFMVGLVIYASVNFRSPQVGMESAWKSAYYFRLFQSVSYETILLVLAWMLLKVNLMLLRKEYRDEFS
jgi:hypothetical protein